MFTSLHLTEIWIPSKYLKRSIIFINTYIGVYEYKKRDNCHIILIICCLREFSKNFLVLNPNSNARCGIFTKNMHSLSGVFAGVVAARRHGGEVLVEPYIILCISAQSIHDRVNSVDNIRRKKNENYSETRQFINTTIT